jgi:hypothetical protein
MSYSWNAPARHQTYHDRGNRRQHPLHRGGDGPSSGSSTTERTLEFLVELSSASDGQGGDEFTEVDRAVAVLVCASVTARARSSAITSLPADEFKPPAACSHPRRTKDFEDVLRKCLRVAEREELLVDPRKLFLVELAGRAVFDKALVPVRHAHSSISSLPGKGDLLWRRVEWKERQRRTIAAALSCRLVGVKQAKERQIP